jgi:SAM-dependent methyltransferase
MQDIIADIQAGLGADLPARCSVPPAQLAQEYVSGERIREQIELLESAVGPLKGRRVLEVGSGFGMFVTLSSREFGANCLGVEPAGPDYANAVSISRRVLMLHGLEPWRVLQAAGEALPFDAGSFDVVYSCNVLEHVQEPRAVIEEAVRVLRPGGYVFFVIPNYGSFWEGHYGLLWVPYLPHGVARWYVRLFGKDPAYLACLQLVNYFSLRRCLRGVEKEVEVLSWGEDVFRYRMKTLDFGEWAAVGTLKRLVRIAKALRLNVLIAEALARCKAHTPLILTVRKKGTQGG